MTAIPSKTTWTHSAMGDLISNCTVEIEIGYDQDKKDPQKFNKKAFEMRTLIAYDSIMFLNL